MASNIATGIGLSGQLQADNSGQLNRLAAEKAAAQERQAQNAAEAKRRADLEKEVRKNLAISADITEDYLQRRWAGQVTKEIADITEAIKNGDENVNVLGFNAKQRLLMAKNAAQNEDKQWQAIKSEMAKDPASYAQFNNPQTIGGVEYANVLEALNKDEGGYISTPEGLAEFEAKYGSTENMIKRNDERAVAMGLPEWSFSYNPIKMVDASDLVNAFSKDGAHFYNQNTKLGKAEVVPGTNNVRQYYGWTLPPDKVEEVGTMIDSDRGVQRRNEWLAEQEFKKNNPDATWVDFAKQYDPSNAPSAKELLRRSVINRGVEPGTILKPEKDKSALGSKDLFVGGARSEDGNYFEIKIPGKDQVSRRFEIPKETKYFVGAEGNPDEKGKVDAKVILDAKPIKISWGDSLGDSHIIYQSDLDPRGSKGEPGAPSATYTYKVGVTRQSLNDLGGNFKIKYEDVARRITELAETDGKNDIKKFLESLGKDPSNAPGGGESGGEVDEFGLPIN